MKSETLSSKTVMKQFNEILEKKNIELFATKLTKKTPAPRNAKEHYQSFIKKKNIKSVKQSKVITQQPKTFENLNIVDIKSVIL